VNANGVGRVEQKARGVWPSGEEGETRKNRLQALLTVFKPAVGPTTEYLIGQYVPDDR